MVVERQTIDNLDPQVSIDYAHSQELVQKDRLIHAIRQPLPLATSALQKVDVMTPGAFSSQLEAVVGASPGPTFWALFSPPPPQRPAAGLFGSELIPSLGGPDKRDAQKRRVMALAPQPIQRSEAPLGWEATLAAQKQTEDQQKLGALFDVTEDLDHDLIAIKSGTIQYQRG